MSIMNYNPNLVFCGRMANQDVRLTFGQWEYRKTMKVVVKGNCRGFSVLDFAIDLALDQLPKDDLDEKTIIMTDQYGEELECCFCDSDEYDEVEWLKNMLLSAEITSITAAKTRKKNHDRNPKAEND